MKFRSGVDHDPENPKASELHVRTLAGHTAVLTHEWRELPAVLHSAAIKAGAEVDSSKKQAKDIEPKASKDAVDQSDEKAQIKKAIKALLKTNDETDFTNDGIPKVASVSREAGFTATKGDVIEVWQALQAEAKE
jgi:hypothetical protein